MADDGRYWARRLGRIIRIAREAQGLSQRDLGAAAQIDQTHVSKIEQGKREAGLDVLVRIARALGVELPALWLPLMWAEMDISQRDNMWSWIEPLGVDPQVLESGDE